MSKEIPGEASVKVITAGHIVDLVYSERSDSPGWVRVDADHMVNKFTGQVVEVFHATGRLGHLSSLRQSVGELRRLINANFQGGENELFLTLTYAENMRDIKRVYSDFKRFWMRLRRCLEGVELKYISVPEPQLRGAWHLHVLVSRCDLRYFYLDNSFVQGIWEQGFVKVQRLENVDNVGAYLSAYLTNVLDDETGVVTKGARLHFYPAGMRLYRCSRNCVRPIVSSVVYKQIKEVLPARPVFSKAYEVEVSGKVVNRVVYEHYNMRREV